MLIISYSQCIFIFSSRIVKKLGIVISLYHYGKFKSYSFYVRFVHTFIIIKKYNLALVVDRIITQIKWIEYCSFIWSFQGSKKYKGNGLNRYECFFCHIVSHLNLHSPSLINIVNLIYYVITFLSFLSFRFHKMRWGEGGCAINGCFGLDFFPLTFFRLFFLG